MSWLDKYRTPLVVLAIALIIIGAAVFFYRHTSLSSTEIVISPPSQDIYVHVEGEVANPGVYKLQQSDLLADAVEAAGGFTPEADSGAINLAAPLRDGEQVHVYKVGEMPQKININTAEAWLLQALSGIGETLAQRIVEYRTAKGPFLSIEDLKNVEGIDSSAFDKIKDKITIH